MDKELALAGITGICGSVLTIASKSSIKDATWQNWLSWNEQTLGGIGAMWADLYYYAITAFVMFGIFTTQSFKGHKGVGDNVQILIFTIISLIYALLFKNTFDNYKEPPKHDPKKPVFPYIPTNAFIGVILLTIIYGLMFERDLLGIAGLFGVISTLIHGIYGYILLNVYTYKPAKGYMKQGAIWVLGTMLYDGFIGLVGLLLAKHLFGFDIQMKKNINVSPKYISVFLTFLIFAVGLHYMGAIYKLKGEWSWIQ